jgi:hypothetical protein
MAPVLLALQAMTVAWFFNFVSDGRTPERFGPYLSESTCEAVRERVIARAHRVSRAEPGVDASECFKVIVQQTEPVTN